MHSTPYFRGGMKQILFILTILFSISFGAKANDPELYCYFEEQAMANHFSYEHFVNFYRDRNLSLENIQNPELYLLAYEWYKTPYRYGGSTKNGIDCSSYVSLLYNQAFELPVDGNSRELYEIGEPVEYADLREGDLIFFKINSSRITHVGVYLQNGKFTHASSSKGVMISDLNESYWSKYYFEAIRVYL